MINTRKGNCYNVVSWKVVLRYPDLRVLLLGTALDIGNNHRRKSLGLASRSTPSSTRLFHRLYPFPATLGVPGSGVGLYNEQMHYEHACRLCVCLFCCLLCLSSFICVCVCVWVSTSRSAPRTGSITHHALSPFFCVLTTLHSTPTRNAINREQSNFINREQK